MTDEEIAAINDFCERIAEEERDPHRFHEWTAALLDLLEGVLCGSGSERRRMDD